MDFIVLAWRPAATFCLNQDPVCKRVFLHVPISSQSLAAPACLPTGTASPCSCLCPINRLPFTACYRILALGWKWEFLIFLVHFVHLDLEVWVFLSILVSSPLGTQILSCMVDLGQEALSSHSPKGS